jgi:hypothetical protein
VWCDVVVGSCAAVPIQSARSGVQRSVFFCGATRSHIHPRRPEFPALCVRLPAGFVLRSLSLPVTCQLY